MHKNLVKMNLTMVEHAANDPRSAAAMLQGNGDGRELPWLAFEKAKPEITDQEILMAQFGHEARYGRIKAGKPKINGLFQKVIFGLVATAIII